MSGQVPGQVPEAPLVLVVEDDDDTRFLYMAELALMGYRTAGESDGARGVDAALKLKPYAILMDVAMPGMNGIDATRHLKEDPRTGGCFVIVMTGGGMARFEEARSAGCDAFFCKPFDAPALQLVLRTLSSPTHSATAPLRTAVVKQCTCGREFSFVQWLTLAPCGRMEVPSRGVVVELRNCPCGSSLAVELDGSGNAPVRTPGAAVARDAMGVPTQKILVVADRDPHIRRLLLQFLGEYTLDFVDDGYSAVEHVRLSAPSAIIAEILIPRLDGLAMCQLLKGDPATQRVPILIISMLAARERARRSGADAFLEKPLQKKSLVAAMRGLLQEKEGASPISARAARTP